MALKSTIFKAELQIADMDRNYYGDHALTIARHPSETDERMMVRLLAFALHADKALTFAKGLERRRRAGPVATGSDRRDRHLDRGRPTR